jgi:hypothetical protein
MASLKSDCLTIKPGLNVDQVCVGDEAYISLTKKYGKIVEIDQSGIETNKYATVYFDIEDLDGNRVRITDLELILVSPKLCTLNVYIGSDVCINDTFKSIDTGASQVVAGFTLVFHQRSNVYILAKKEGEVSINRNILNVPESIKASRTGIVEATGDCGSSSGLKFKSTLLKCAKNEFLKQASVKCNNLQNGKGRITTIDWKSNGTMNPLFKSGDVNTAIGVFIPVAESCEIGASAKCEKSN